jgi:hypothetical protein
MLKFYLDAIQFALGDLDAPTTPSARLTPAVRVRENLGWRVAGRVFERSGSTLFESIDRACNLGLSYIVGSSEQRISQDLRDEFGPALTENQRQQIRLKLDESGLRLLAYHRRHDGQPVARETLEFARMLGVETVILDCLPDALDQLASWSDELDLRLAIACGSLTDPALLGDLLKRCQSASPRVGVHVDLAECLRAGRDPAGTVALIGSRLFGLQLPASLQDQPNASSGANSIESWLAAIRDSGAGPVLFTLDLPEPASAIRPLLDTVDAVSVRLAR